MKTKLGGWPLTQSPDPALEALGSMPAQQSKQTPKGKMSYGLKI